MILPPANSQKRFLLAKTREVAEFSRAIIASGATIEPEEIVDTAIQITELIIEKTKENN